MAADMDSQWDPNPSLMCEAQDNGWHTGARATVSGLPYSLYTRLIGNFIKQLMFEHSGAEQLANAIVNSLPPAIQCQLTVKKSQVEGDRGGNHRRAAACIWRASNDFAAFGEVHELNSRAMVD